jgi:hypothetical protein
MLRTTKDLLITILSTVKKNAGHAVNVYWPIQLVFVRLPDVPKAMFGFYAAFRFFRKSGAESFLCK